MSEADVIKDDLNNLLLEQGDVFSVETSTEEIDGMGNVTSVTSSQFRIYGYLMDISKKDRKVQDMGLAVPGNRIIYLKASYDMVSGGVTTSYVVKEDDVLIDREQNEWRIVKIITEPNYNDEEIYKKAIVKNISLEGS